MKEHAEAYARASTLHGFAYMGETDRNWKEKYSTYMERFELIITIYNIKLLYF